MKKITPVLILFVLLIASVASNVSALQTDFAGPAELQYYDAQIDILLPRLDAFQSQYYAVNGRYYQALQSHTAAPDVPTVPDGIEEHPTDQPEDLALFWESFAELPEVLAWSFRIDTYASPDGDGYVLTVETVIDGETWTRSVNHGPESEDWRGADWYHVTPFEF